MKKIDRQPRCSRSRPPKIGPLTTASPAAADHRPIARARRLSGTPVLMMLSDVGCMPAAATPMSARRMMSTSGDVLRPASMEKTPKRAVAARIARRCPSLPPMTAHTKMKAPKERT